MREIHVIIDIKSSLNEIDICLVLRFNYAQTISNSGGANRDVGAAAAMDFVSAHSEYRLRYGTCEKRIWTNNCGLFFSSPSASSFSPPPSFFFLFDLDLVGCSQRLVRGFRV